MTKNISQSAGCSRTACPHSQKCARHQAYLWRMEHDDTVEIISPSRLPSGDEECPHFLVKRRIKVGYGFEAMYDTVPTKNSHYFFNRIGMKQRRYYYYKGGDSKYPIYGELAELICRCIAEAGGDPSVGFDRYQTEEHLVKP